MTAPNNQPPPIEDARAVEAELDALAHAIAATESDPDDIETVPIETITTIDIVLVDEETSA